MLHGLEHRGPDESGEYVAQNVALGIRRLSIMDPRGGHQPLSNETGTVHVVCNGELYGFEQTRERLEARGHEFRTRSDVEILVHLYEEYELDLFEHLEGMFAFALFDENKQRLLLARDRFGIKPLYFARVGPTLVFGSELDACLSDTAVPRTLDPHSVDEYFELSYVNHPKTFYASVQQLEPGSFALMDANGFTQRSYWHLPTENCPLPADEALASLDEAIGTAVRQAMRCDVSMGAFLSGGLDSSTVVHHMRQHTEAPLKTFTARFEDVDFDEGVEAREIAQVLGTDHHELWVGPQDLAKFSRMMTGFGQPFSDPAVIPNFLIAEFAREHVRVVMTGDGGDELLGGYRRYRASTLTERLRRFPPHLGNLARRIPSRPTNTLVGRIRRILMGRSLPAEQRHAFWLSVFTDENRSHYYQQGFRETLQAANRSPTFERWRSIFDEPRLDLLMRFQHLDLKTYLVDNNLTKVDRTSMASSLEARVPLLSRGVLDAAMRLPWSLRQHRSETKVALRRLMASRLPENIVSMRKKGFGVPLGRWFRGPLRDFVQSTLDTDRVTQTGVLDPQPVQALLHRHLEGHEDVSWRLWTLICFIRWHERRETSP